MELTNEQELEIVAGGANYQCSSIEEFTNFLNGYL